MSFRKRLRSKNYSSNASNNICNSNEWGAVELESWVSFPSQDEEVKSQLWEYSLNSIKQEPKEQLLDQFNKLKKREAKQFDKLSFQQLILSEFRRFTDGVFEEMDNQNKMRSELVTTIKTGTLLLQFITVIITTNFYSLISFKINKAMLLSTK